MADIEAEIARLQAELAHKKLEVDTLRQAQPNWDDFTEEEYDSDEWIEEEIIEEYSDEEWEEEIIEDEYIEEEIIEEEEIVEDEPMNQYSAAPAPAPAPAPRAVTQPPAPAVQAPVTQRPPPPAATQQPTKPSGLSWMTGKQKSYGPKKTPVPIISSAGAAAPAPAVPAPAPAPAAAKPKVRPPPGAAPASAAPPPQPAPPAAADDKPKPRVRAKGKIRPPPDAKGNVIEKKAPPPGLEVEKKKGPRLRIINWGANRRSNEEIQAAQKKNFKPGTPGATEDGKPAKVKRNYVIPKNVRPPPPPDGAKPDPISHKRRVIPDIPASPPGEESIWEVLLGPKLVANSKMQKKNTIACMKDQELVGLYFGAKWQSNCKRFNPRLRDFYFSVAQPHNFEIIYVSSDRSLQEFKDAMMRFPFLALGGGTASYKNFLAKQLKVIDQPTLVVLDDDGLVVTVDAVPQIMALEKGNLEQANALVDRWKRTRPVPMDQVQLDPTLKHEVMQRGILYWSG